MARCPSLRRTPTVTDPASYEVADGIATVTIDRPEQRNAERTDAAVYASEDAQEGSRGFAEKRTPAWKGR